MAEKEICELNHRHMAIAEYIIAHPSARLGEISKAVGVSASWISIVTNSELFRDYFLRRHKEVSDAFHVSLQDKVSGVAHLAVEKLGRAVEESTDPDYILAAADRTLKHLGFGNPKAPAVQFNQVNQVHHSTTHVSTSVVEEARAKIHRLAGIPDGTSLSPAEGVQTREPGRLGSSAPAPALVYQEKETQGPEGSGRTLRGEGPCAPGRELDLSTPPRTVD